LRAGIAMERLERFLNEKDILRRAQACYQCGTCAAGCPVTRWRGTFNPRVLIERLLRKETGELLKDEGIWLCAACLTCLERCPQSIEVSEILVQLKNAAARMGNIPESELRKDREIIRCGWVQLPGSRITRMREELGLPEIPPGVAAIEMRALACETGWIERMEGDGGAGDGHPAPRGEVAEASMKQEKGDQEA
jgi:heterodisulfide reductase subunit C2